MAVTGERGDLDLGNWIALTDASPVEAAIVRKSLVALPADPCIVHGIAAGRRRRATGPNTRGGGHTTGGDRRTVSHVVRRFTNE